MTYGLREVAWGPKEVMEWSSEASEQLTRAPWILLISCETTFMPKVTAERSKEPSMKLQLTSERPQITPE